VACRPATSWSWGPTHAFSADRWTLRTGGRTAATGEAAAIGMPQLLARLRRWDPAATGRFAWFDTRVTRIRHGRTAAAVRAAHVLARLGLHPVTYPTAFIVGDHRGPVTRQETDRTREWGAMVAASVAAFRDDGPVGRPAEPAVNDGAGRPASAFALR